MSKPVLTIKADTPFTEACRMFHDFSIHHLPVISNKNELIGLFSFTDAMRAFNDKVYNSPTITESGINEKVKVEDIMTSDNLYTLESADLVDDAIAIFKDNQINSIPIVEEGKLVGILTTNDLIKKVC